MRSTQHPLEADGPDVEGLEFGAAHAGLMMGLFRDGSFRPVSFGVDRVLFNNLGIGPTETSSI